MSGSDTGGKRLIEVPVCEDRLEIEFRNLCYYPSGKKGESVCFALIIRNAIMTELANETDLSRYYFFFSDRSRPSDFI